jgi:acyl-CoA thioesterase
MGALQDDTRMTGTGPWRLRLSRDWELWGPNGGYLSAVALRAAGAAVGGDRRPVSYSCQYLRTGTFADTAVSAEVMREGRTATCVNVRLEQSGQALLQAQVWSASPREGPHAAVTAAPAAPPPEGLTQLPDMSPDAPGAAFRNNFDRRPVPPQAADLAQGHMQQWFRYRGYDGGGDAFLDAARSVLLIDTMVLPAHVHGQGGRIGYQATTLSLNVAFHRPAPEKGWLLADARSEQAADGAIHGEVLIWTEDQRLIASGSSTLVLAVRSVGGDASRKDPG